MSEVITAVFGDGSAASAALDDLKAARIPSARVIPNARSNGTALYPDPSRQCAMISVAVDDPHAELVSGILGMYAPVAVRKRAA